MNIDPIRNIPNHTSRNLLNDKLNSKDVQNLSENFNKVLNNKGIRNKEKVKKVTEWINSLSDMRENLKNETTKDNLSKYKDSIKSFLEYYIENEVYLESLTIPNGAYHTKTLKIIKTLNKEVGKLTEELLNDQQGNLDLLKTTGRIQGMLFELMV